MASGNDDFPWDEFNSSVYYEHNYVTLQGEDEHILDAVGSFFSSAGIGPDAHGIDVGSGANLYPLFAMLPFCQDVVLWEWSAANVRWLKEETQSYSVEWDPFWAVLTRYPAYGAVTEPRDMVGKRGRPQQGSIFDLPAARWDVGTMFFVAESLTAEVDEFERATRCFVGALKPGAPFAAAFMAGSKGYPVAGVEFPAVDVGVEEVRKCLDDITSDLTVFQVERTGAPLRDGYSGMILAHGRAGAA